MLRNKPETPSKIVSNPENVEIFKKPQNLIQDAFECYHLFYYFPPIFSIYGKKIFH